MSRSSKNTGRQPVRQLFLMAMIVLVCAGSVGAAGGETDDGAEKAAISPTSFPLLVSETHPTLFELPTSHAGRGWPAKRWKATTKFERGDHHIMWGWSGPGFREFGGDTSGVEPDPGQPQRTAYYASPFPYDIPQGHHEWEDIWEVEWWTGAAGDEDWQVRNYVFGSRGTNPATTGIWLTDLQTGPFRGHNYPGVPQGSTYTILQGGWYGPYLMAMNGQSSQRGPASEAAFFVDDMNEHPPGSYQRVLYCNLIFAKEQTENDVARKICKDAPYLREVVQVYDYPQTGAGTPDWGCERMVYAYGYPLSYGSDAAWSERVKEYMRNGELLWGSWVGGTGTAPATNAAADSACSWSVVRNVLSYTGVYKVGNDYYFDNGTDGNASAWAEMHEGNRCSSNSTCTAFNDGNFSYHCVNGFCQCNESISNCP